MPVLLVHRSRRGAVPAHLEIAVRAAQSGDAAMPLPAPPPVIPGAPLLEDRTAHAGRPALDDPACDVCPHPAAGHDAIGRRFCQATLDGAISRGCVCRSS